MMDAFVKIPQREGVTGLFKGLSPALLRQCTYTPLAMVLFPVFRNAMCKPGEDPGYFVRLFAGGTAGSVAITVMNPTEVLKTQMQGSYQRRMTMREVFTSVYETEGVRGFWAGIKPNIARTFLVNAAELGTYDHAKVFLVGVGLVKDGTLLQHVSASGMAGLCSALVSTPADVVKTRLMNQSGHQHEYTGTFNCLFTVLRTEGFLALYKGFAPILARKLVWCTAFFASYERISEYFTKSRTFE